MTSKPAFDPGENEYSASRDIARGVIWAVLMRWVIRFIGLFSTLILARLLSPEDFGIAAMGTMVVYFLFSLSELAASAHLIRTKTINAAHCDTAWSITVLQGLFTAAALVALALPASAYFGEPRVVEVMYVLALASFIGAFESIGPVLLRREMKFEIDFRFNVIKKVFIFVATVSSALVLRNYWALVIGHLAGTTAGVALSYVVHNYRPRWSLALGGEYLRFGMKIVPLQIANTLRGMAAPFLVAGVGNPATLGSFRVAADLSYLFTAEIVTPMGRGLLPNYSRLANRPEELSLMYRKILGLVALVCFPVGVGVAAVAHDLTLVLLGSQWGFAAELMQYLAIGAAVYAFSIAMENQILIATGHEKSAAVLAWVRLGITIPILWVGLEIDGAMGLAQATMLAPTACLPFIYKAVQHAVSISLGALAGLMWRPLLAAVVMYLAVKTLHVGDLDWAILRLAADVLVGGCVYVIVTMALWAISGRPDNSAERTALGMVVTTVEKLRARFSS